MKHNRLALAISIVGLAALFSMLILTSPTEVGPFGVLLFFTTLYISLFGVFLLILGFFLKLAFGITVLHRKEYLGSAVMAFGPILLLMVGSFGALNLWTISLIAFFLFLAEFLVAKKA